MGCLSILILLFYYQFILLQRDLHTMESSGFRQDDGYEQFASRMKEELSSLRNILDDRLFKDVFEKELAATYPNYRESLANIYEDVSRRDLKIIVAGNFFGY
jgi:hypothetical protein